RDLSVMDWSVPADISADGKSILLSEVAASGGPAPSVYLRPTDGSLAKQLGDGIALALSPDGQWAIVRRETRLWLVRTGPGESRPLSGPPLKLVGGAGWLPDGRRVVFSAREKGEGDRIYVQAIDGGEPRPISPQGVTLLSFGACVSPDGHFV